MWGLWEKKWYGTIFQNELSIFCHSSEVIDFNSFCEMVKWTRIGFPDISGYRLFVSSWGLWSFPADHTTDCSIAWEACEKSLPLSTRISFLLHKIFPADLEQCSGFAGGNCCFRPQWMGRSSWCHRRPIVIIHKKTVSRALIASGIGLHLIF